MTVALASFLVIYLCISLYFFCTPVLGAIGKLFLYIFDKRLSLPTRWHVFTHVFSLVFYAPFALLLTPIDLFLSFLLGRFSPEGAPVFICGTPRSGSTLLHRLLIDSSSEFYGISHLEWRLPSVSIQLMLQVTGIKAFLSRMDYWSGSSVSSQVSKMHSCNLGDYEEDAILFEERCGYHPYQYLHVPVDALNMVFGGSMPDSTHKAASSIDRRLLRFFRLYVRAIRILKLPSARLVSKEVASNHRLGLVARFFPSAKFVVITRQPSEYLSSLYPLLDLSTQAKTRSSRHLDDPSWWHDWYEWLVWQADNLRCFYLEYLPTGRILHVRYEDLVSSPRIQILRVMSFCGVTPTAQAYDMLERFESTQPSRNRGYSYAPVSFDDNDFFRFSQVFYASGSDLPPLLK